MVEHTKGPWVFHPEEGRAPDGYFPIFGPVKARNGHTFYPRIVSVGAAGGPIDANDPDGNYRARDEANAHLVAAAPELLSALEMVRGFLPEIEGLTIGSSFWAPINAAIRKARGEVQP